jgi:hypothetical protein
MLLFRDLITNMAKGAKIFNQVEKILVISQVSYQSGLMIAYQNQSQSLIGFRETECRNSILNLQSHVMV